MIWTSKYPSGPSASKRILLGPRAQSRLLLFSLMGVMLLSSGDAGAAPDTGVGGRAGTPRLLLARPHANVPGTATSVRVIASLRTNVRLVGRAILRYFRRGRAGHTYLTRAAGLYGFAGGPV